MGKLIPIILILVGAAAGVGVGKLLQPSADTEMAASEGDAARASEPSADDGHGGADDPADDGHAPEPDDHAAPAEDSGDHGEEASGAAIEYVALRRQLIVPLIEGDRVGSLMVLSLTIEATGGNIELIYDREPKLRDEFLQVLFRHANTGGFDGVFTSGEAMSDLKSALNAAAHDVLGSVVQQVLVTEILRQEI